LELTRVDVNGICFEAVRASDPEPITTSRLCHFRTTIQSTAPTARYDRFGNINSAVMLSEAKHLWRFCWRSVRSKINPRFFTSLRMTF
jgi:hypothetical protein